MLSARIHEGWHSLEHLEGAWDRILRSCTNGTAGPDATCSFAWARALQATHLAGAQVRLLEINSNTETLGILPMFLTSSGNPLVFPQELRAITEAYSGRCGLLVANNDPEVIRFLLERLIHDVPGWDVFVFRTVEPSPTHGAVMAAARDMAFKMRILGVNESPYIVLGSSWDDTVARLPKKMRWTIRKAEKQLRSKGRLEYVRFTDAESELMESIYRVERSSWKERSGTSITSQKQQMAFYEALVEEAGRAGVLSAHVLRLNSHPIAYVLGIEADDGVFLDLKESFDTQFSACSPGHVLKRFAIESLLSDGVGIYDFMGRCEPYKMRWTDRKYRSVTLALFKPTIKGRLSYLRSRLSGKKAAAV